MVKGIVNKIIPFSSVDGPGNRTAIFLQGCNFNCLYCHNPETINICSNCGICVQACPYGALEKADGKVIWDYKSCQNCDICIRACPNDSSPKIREMSVEDVLKEINKVKEFISGITVSGGECTLQYDFVTALFNQARKLGLSTFLDTNGFISLKDKYELINSMDMAMVDIKSYNAKEHIMLTGKDNKTVLDNVKYLGEIGKLYEVRTVIVPEILDNYFNVDNISKFIASINPYIRYKIIKYRPVGVRMDLIKSYVPSDDIMNELSDIAYKNGCKNVIVV
ncbi:glycine radical enzyme activase, YjjW family [Caminicella sporogenes DSM 14501]|uniref:Glycine radical enzyme activase, YjjW family n=1 Tax=Caminicella sporogenes DSM 14501 TaxID=1121266 RepID=A0A1M6MJD6_9FIRM|nr:YjjW family glycine radical enzyme activase [Caminicella sporogenes]RKD27524.1 glycine radical enzyme activase [Caminicella sporogenes]SHJ83578.1 glycine radical enzyme activase, YjjW family [Caminicella sporogenes DSM 14501]